MLGFAAYLWTLWRTCLKTCLKNTTTKTWRFYSGACLIGLAALWDPVIRWGTLVVRTEIWIGWVALLVLRELDRFSFSCYQSNSKEINQRYWRLAGWLALGASIHFEAVLLVPICMIGLLPNPFSPKTCLRTYLRTWSIRLIQVAIRTLLFLLPWILYVFMHFQIFLEQMQIQFSRLTHGNQYIANPYLLFHSLFLKLGNPVDYPKFFNVGKGIFWLSLLILNLFTIKVTILATIEEKRKSQKYQYNSVPNPTVTPLVNPVAHSMTQHQSRHLAILWAAAAGFWISFYLWCTKPEVWFITLCHVSLWSWMGYAWVYLIRNQDEAQKELKIFSLLFIGIPGSFSLIAFAATLAQQLSIPSNYSWSVYQDWVSCIERTIHSNRKEDSISLWQTHVPDVLVELSKRQPQWDLTRALDFEAFRGRAWSYSEKVDVILFTRFFYDSKQPQALPYEGPERPKDLQWLTSEADLPFSSWRFEQFLKEHPQQRQMFVCYYGPFFADLAIRKN
jgi:hypothetical protein